jgi:hypothetical protein
MQENSFAGDDPNDDPYNHLNFFTELCWTIKLRSYSDDELKLKLFSQSLTNTNLFCRKINTWEDLKREFIFCFYPKVKSAEARRVITNFKNHRGESMVRAYLRYRGMVQICPHNDLPPWYVSISFMEDLSKIIQEN